MQMQLGMGVHPAAWGQFGGGEDKARRWLLLVALSAQEGGLLGLPQTLGLESEHGTCIFWSLSAVFHQEVFHKSIHLLRLWPLMMARGVFLTESGCFGEGPAERKETPETTQAAGVHGPCVA